MSEKRMQRAEMWEYFKNIEVPVYKVGRKKADKDTAARHIRYACIVNGDRLIMGHWRGADAQFAGVYYMTPSGQRLVSHDGEEWCQGKAEYVALGGWNYWTAYSTYGYRYECIGGEIEARAWLREHWADKSWYYNHRDVIDDVDYVEDHISLQRRMNAEQRRIKKWSDWANGMPPLPDDFKDWAHEVAFDGAEYAFGNKDSDVYYCTACGKTHKQKTWKHRGRYECSRTGKKIKCEKVEKNGIERRERLMIVQSYHTIDGEICSVVRHFTAWMSWSRSGSVFGISPDAALVLRLDGRSTVCGDDIVYNLGREKWDVRNPCGYQHNKCYCYPDVSALAGTAYGHIAIDVAAAKGWRLHYNNLMRGYYDDPRMEYLIKGNFKKLVEEISLGGCLNSTLFPGENVQEVLGIDGQSVARLRQNNGGRIYLAWLRAAFMSYSMEKGKTGVSITRNMRIPEKTIEYFQKNNISPNDVAVPLNIGISPEQIANYIEKQRKLIGNGTGYITITWRDTLNMTDTLQLAGGTYTLFPKNLKARHAELVGIKELARLKEECKRRAENLYSYLSEIGGEIKRIETMYPSISEICTEIRDKFEWGNSEYSVVVPDNVQDIVVEGHLLGHCIAKPKRDGTYLYFERMQERETYIMFLRKADKPKSPWYTMEVEPGGAVRQLRTFGDDEGTDRDEAKAFLKKWRREIAKRLGEAEREAAQISREKRLAEFEELRRGGNLIRNGKLAGKLLVEVLEADFREFNEETA